VALRRASQVNGMTGICLTKLDVLDTLPEIKVCVAYEKDGHRYDLPPSSAEDYAEMTPVY
jgi:adenylosuccinate synthase